MLKPFHVKFGWGNVKTSSRDKDRVIVKRYTVINKCNEYTAKEKER